MLTQTAENYTSHTSNASDCWEIVSGALVDQGVTAPRPAPSASLSFKPRHLRAGSDAAQRDLHAIAGWTLTRRGILGGLLALAATPAAAALPEIAPVPECAPAPAVGVSPRMAALISDLMSRHAALAGLGSDADANRWDDAGQDLADALTALVNERPTTLADLAAKMTALAEVEQPDGCGTCPLLRLAEDATALVGEGNR